MCMSVVTCDFSMYYAAALNVGALLGKVTLQSRLCGGLVFFLHAPPPHERLPSLRLAASGNPERKVKCMCYAGMPSCVYVHAAGSVKYMVLSPLGADESAMTATVTQNG